MKGGSLPGELCLSDMIDVVLGYLCKGGLVGGEGSGKFESFFVEAFQPFFFVEDLLRFLDLHPLRSMRKKATKDALDCIHAPRYVRLLHLYLATHSLRLYRFKSIVGSWCPFRLLLRKGGGFC